MHWPHFFLTNALSLWLAGTKYQAAMRGLLGLAVSQTSLSPQERHKTPSLFLHLSSEVGFPSLPASQGGVGQRRLGQDRSVNCSVLRYYCDRQSARGPCPGAGMLLGRALP